MPTNNPYLETDKKMVGDTYTSPEIWENLRILTDEFGSRFGGTAGESKAADFLRKKLLAYGLKNVTAEPIEYLGWRRGKATLEILSPIQKTIPCISLPHSPAATLEATLIDLGDAPPTSFAERATDIQSKIFMVTSVVSPDGATRWVHRNEKLGRGILAGGAGFIFVNHYPGYGPATGGIGHRGRASLIPGISLAYEDGAFLSRLAARGEVKIRLITTDVNEPMTSWNVLGEIPGKSKEVVMLGSHYDGHDISQGAEDPASGTVAVLEAARVLAKYVGELACTVRFAFWGIEEIGLLGSNEYAKVHADELDRVRFYFNMDSAGAIKSKGVVLNEWPELAPLFNQWSTEMSHPYLVGQSVNAHSDHFPFLLAGVPTAGMESVKKDLSGRGFGHTAYDTLDKVEVTSLREAAALASRLALRVANAEDWPAKRRDAEAVKTMFSGPQYEEEARFREAIGAYYDARR